MGEKRMFRELTTPILGRRRPTVLDEVVAASRSQRACSTPSLIKPIVTGLGGR